MQLHTVKPQLDHAVDLRLGVLEILVHGAESDELGMQLALLGDEVVDGGDRMSRGGDRMHDEVRDGRASHSASSASGVPCWFSIGML